MIFIKKEVIILEDPVVEEENDGDVEVFTSTTSRTWSSD